VFDPHLKSTGRDYTLTAAWLAIAAIFIPATLLALRPGNLISSLAFLWAAVYVTMAWVTWKRSSKLTIPSFAVQPTVRND
jgi:hypothetical protein